MTHQVRAEGFGKPIQPDFRKGKYDELSKYIGENLLTQEDRKILTDSGYDTSKLDSTINALINSEICSAVTHHDLGLHNVLGIDNNLVLFDPDPTIDMQYIDLATSYIWAIIQSDRDNAEQMLISYIDKVNSFNRQLFEKALYIRLLSKHARWIRRKDSDISQDCIKKTIWMLR